MEKPISPRGTSPAAPGSKSSENSLLRPPIPNPGLIKKVGPAETGHLTPRSRSASRSSTCSNSNVAPASSSSASDLPLARSAPATASGSRSGITFERSRSSGRLTSENGGGELNRSGRASAASTSVLANIGSGSASASAAGGISGGGGGGHTASKTSLVTTCASTGPLSLSTIQSNGGSKSTTVDSANAASAASASPFSRSKSAAGVANHPNTGALTSTGELPEHRKSKKFLQQWRQKTSMSKLGKGTRSLVSEPPIFRFSQVTSPMFLALFVQFCLL